MYRTVLLYIVCTAQSEKEIEKRATCQQQRDVAIEDMARVRRQKKVYTFMANDRS
jgi:hypothetical protein